MQPIASSPNKIFFSTFPHQLVWVFAISLLGPHELHYDVAGRWMGIFSIPSVGPIPVSFQYLEGTVSPSFLPITLTPRDAHVTQTKTFILALTHPVDVWKAKQGQSVYVHGI